MSDLPHDLDDDERALYQWQLWVRDFGEAGQRKLKNSSVLVSRVGGVGGALAHYLAAAGVGRLVLAHAGNVRPSDLHRQTLMTHDWIGKPRVESAKRRLNELNPRIQVEAVNENISEANAERLIAGVDLIADCAPLFAERYLMNREAVRRKIPLVECAMFDMEVQVTSILPGKTPCLRCLYPETPPAWKREFPVFGAVAGVAGTLGATEAIKILAGFGEPLFGRLMLFDLRAMRSRELQIVRNPACKECACLNKK